VSLARHRDFVHLWCAQTVSAFGSRITRTALPVIAIVMVNADPIELAILGSLSVVPGVVVGLFGGGFVDRNSKRPVLVATDLLRALLVFSVPLAAWYWTLSIEQLYVVAGAVGACSALFQMTDGAYLPVVIGRERLVEGNSKLQASDSVAEIGGPGITGVLIQAMTAPVTLVIDAVSYVVSALLIFRMTTIEQPIESRHATPSVVDDVRIGVRAGFGHPIVGRTFWTIAIDDLSNGFFMGLYTLFALKALAIDVATLGIVIGLGGVGALAGAFIAATLSGRFGLGRAMVATFAIGKAAGLSIVAAALQPSSGVAWLSLGQLAGDGALVAFSILASSYRQAVLPLDVMARANGLLQVLGGVLTPLGAFVAGALATATSVPTALQVGVAIGLFAVIPLLRRRIVELQAPPHEDATPPSGIVGESSSEKAT
jgi:MFS family permease